MNNEPFFFQIIADNETATLFSLFAAILKWDEVVENELMAQVSDFENRQKEIPDWMWDRHKKSHIRQFRRYGYDHGRELLGSHLPIQKLSFSSTVTVLKNPAGGGSAAIGGGWRARNRCGLLRYAAVPA